MRGIQVADLLGKGSALVSDINNLFHTDGDRSSSSAKAHKVFAMAGGSNAPGICRALVLTALSKAASL